MAKFSSVGSAAWRVIEWLSTQIGLIAGGLILIMMIAVVREVIGRYFFGAPSDWSLELSCYLMVGMAYLSAASTELADKHIRIDLIYVRFKGKSKNLADIFIHAVGLCWSAVLVWKGCALAWHSLVTDARSAEVLMWPLFPSQVMVPIGALLMGLVLIGKMLKSISCLRKGGN